MHRAGVYSAVFRAGPPRALMYSVEGTATISPGHCDEIGGWKTKAMFSRYNVMNSERIRAAMVKGAEYVEQKMKQA